MLRVQQWWVGAVIPRGFLLVPGSATALGPRASVGLHSGDRTPCGQNVLGGIHIRVLGMRAVGAPEYRLALTGFRVHMPTR